MQQWTSAIQTQPGTIGLTDIRRKCVSGRSRSTIYAQSEDCVSLLSADTSSNAAECNWRRQFGGKTGSLSGGL
jgi:hypothetical protein